MKANTSLRLVDGELVHQHKLLLKDVEDYLENARGVIVILKEETNWNIQIWRNGLDGDQALGVLARAIHKMQTTCPDIPELTDE